MTWSLLTQPTLGDLALSTLQALSWYEEFAFPFLDLSSGIQVLQVVGQGPPPLTWPWTWGDLVPLL